MERVHFYQEQMLPELKEFEEKGIFSQPETRAILKQRTAFESALIRRVALKSDYIKYVQYEITLEALRRKRVERLNATETKTSLSDYSIIRRQFYILERAVRKFKNDVSLWIHYIELAKSNKARALVGKLCSGALSLHPNSSSLYIIAASHELDTSLSPAGARVLLQRGLRINPQSVVLWVEYVRMELGYCEGLRRRWKVLGVDNTADDVNGEAREAILSGKIIEAAISSATQALPTLELLGSLQCLLQSYPTELRAYLVNHLHSEFASRDMGSGPAAEDYHCGAVLLRATANLPSRPLDQGAQLPRVPPLRLLVAAAFPIEQSPFPPSEETPEFVRLMQKASETLSIAGKDDVRVAELYARWVAAWVAVITEKSLSLYLVLALTTTANHLCKANIDMRVSQSLSTVLRITLHLNKTTSPDESQYRKLAKIFSKVCWNDVGLWIARLDAESGANKPLDSELSTYSPTYDLPEPVERIWAEAREKAEEIGGEKDLLVDLWTWGLRHLSRGSESPRIVDLWKVVLRQSLSHTSPTLHSMLLLRRLYDDPGSPNTRAGIVKMLVAQYRPSISFFDLAMDQETVLLASSQAQDYKKCDGPPRKKRRKGQTTQIVPLFSAGSANTSCLETVYSAWRTIPDQHIPAALKWAASLWRLGEEDKANNAIIGAGGSKGKLRQEWDRLREELSRNGTEIEEMEMEVKEPAQAGADISLEHVEFV